MKKFKKSYIYPEAIVVQVLQMIHLLCFFILEILQQRYSSTIQRDNVLNICWRRQSPCCHLYFHSAMWLLTTTWLLSTICNTMSWTYVWFEHLQVTLNHHNLQSAGALPDDTLQGDIAYFIVLVKSKKSSQLSSWGRA